MNAMDLAYWDARVLMSFGLRKHSINPDTGNEPNIRAPRIE
jgi:hypothetical protein